MIKVEEYIKEKHKEYIRVASKHTLEIRFDKIFDNNKLEDINIFIIKPKQAYYSNTHLYCPYINYFIEKYDDDNELLLSYLKIKFMIDRGTNYSKETFIDDLFTYILSPSMVKKIEKMTEDNYNIELSSNSNNSYLAIQFDNEHGKILLNIGMAIKIFIPIVTHFIYINNIKDIDLFLSETFGMVLSYFEKDNNMYNKLYEFINHKINGTNARDKNHWNKVEIYGTDIESETEKVMLRVLVDILYKYRYDGNIIAMNAQAIRNNINWTLKTNFSKNLKPLSDSKDEDGLSEFDKIEMNMSKFDESFVIIGGLNIKQTIKKLRNKYDIVFDETEIQYYIDNLNVHKIQRNLIFNLFGKYFGNIRDMYSLNLVEYAKLIIIMKKMLSLHGFRIIQHILTGVMHTNPHVKRMPKKQYTEIVNSDIYKQLQVKYKATFDIISTDNALFDRLNNILNANITLVDYDLAEKTHSHINIQKHTKLIIDEYLKLIDMI